MQPAGIYVIGLTGGIACGKSTVQEMLAECGAWTLDADAVTHRLQQPGHHVYEEIVATFGGDIVLYPDGPINRRKLGKRVFSNPAELQQLERIVHPAVRIEVLNWLDKLADQRYRMMDNERVGEHVPVAVIDAIKLLESGWNEYCDAIWVVTCTASQQIERLIERRGLSEADARERVAAQPPQEMRLAEADVVIDNSGTLEQTRQQVEAGWLAIMQQ